MIGAALLGAVVVKLFLVDLAGSGTVARIVSFVGVGALLLVIGYVAPVPPGAREDDASGAAPDGSLRSLAEGAQHERSTAHDQHHRHDAQQGLARNTMERAPGEAQSDPRGRQHGDQGEPDSPVEQDSAE